MTQAQHSMGDGRVKAKRALADPEFAAVPVDCLTSKACAKEARRTVDRGETFTVPRWRAHEIGTTQLSVIDQWGNAVALTHSLGSASGVVTDGLGVQYNNCMNCFNPVPGHVNSIAPGKARASGITPTIIMKDDKVVMIVGARNSVSSRASSQALRGAA